MSTRLRLEPLIRAHADEMFRPLSAAAIYEYIPGRPPVSVAELRQRYHRLEQRRSPDGRQQWLNWVVRLNSGQCAGFVQATIHAELSADFAYVIAPEHWGRGVALEACQAVLPYLAREGRVQALFSTVDPRNARSVRLLERLGFCEVAPERYPHGTVEPNDRVFTLCLDASAPVQPTDWRE